MSDLFSPTISKKQQVLEFIQSKGRCRTSDIIRFGMSIYHNRAERDARNLSEEGKIWRMREDIKRIVYGATKEDAWSVYPADKDY